MERYSGEHSVFELVNMVAGLLLWAAHLGVIYGVHAIACARGWQEAVWLGMGVVPLVIMVATGLGLLGSAWVLFNALRDMRALDERSDRDQPDLFLSYTTATVAGFAMLAILWAATPALFIAPCA